MNGHMKAHGTHMLIGGAGVALLAIVFGVGWQQAVTWGLLLACLLGMIGVMWSMGRQSSGGRQHGGQSGDQAAGCHRQGADVPSQRVSEPFVPER